MAKIATGFTIDHKVNDKLVEVARKLGTNKSDLASNLLSLGLHVLELANYQDLDNLENKITLGGSLNEK